MKTITSRSTLLTILLAAMALGSFATQAQAGYYHNGYRHDGYRDDGYRYGYRNHYERSDRDYVWHHNHRGYWDNRGGVRFFINID